MPLMVAIVFAVATLATGTFAVLLQPMTAEAQQRGAVPVRTVKYALRKDVDGCRRHAGREFRGGPVATMVGGSFVWQAE